MSNLNTHDFLLPLEHKEFLIRISTDALELYVDNCLRKRDDDPNERLYVWTNIELNWEEHRFVEARYSRRTGELCVTVNGDAVLVQKLTI